MPKFYSKMKISYYDDCSDITLVTKEFGSLGEMLRDAAKFADNNPDFVCTDDANGMDNCRLEFVKELEKAYISNRYYVEGMKL